MDKRSASILIGCLICTSVVVLLFLIAYQMSLRSCELIYLDPLQHRLAALNSWQNATARRSHEKTLLLRISAHLEYNLPQANQSEQPALMLPQPIAQNQSSLSPMGQQHPHQQLPQAQFLQQPLQQPLQQQLLQQPPQQSLQPAPSGFNITFQTQPIQPVQQPQNYGQTNTVRQQQFQPFIPQINSTSTNLQSITEQATSNNTLARHRFLALHLDRIELERKHNESTFEYKILMNCTTILAVFSRQADKIRLSHARLELKPSNRKQNKCDLIIPNPNLFEAEIDLIRNEGFAHHDSQPNEPLRCVDRKTGDLLATLDIHALEFETALNPKREVGRKFKRHQA